MSKRTDHPVTPRLTRHRQTVLETVAARPLHLTAAEIYDRARSQDPGIAYATVYNALHYLVEVGLIAEVRRPDGVVSYDRKTLPHDHVICRLCQRIGDVSRDPHQLSMPSVYVGVAQQTGFLIDQHRVEYVGLCPDCQLLAPSGAIKPS